MRSHLHRIYLSLYLAVMVQPWWSFLLTDCTWCSHLQPCVHTKITRFRARVSEWNYSTGGMSEIRCFFTPSLLLFEVLRRVVAMKASCAAAFFYASSSNSFIFTRTLFFIFLFFAWAKQSRYDVILPRTSLPVQLAKQRNSPVAIVIPGLISNGFLLPLYSRALTGESACYLQLSSL